MSNKIHNKFSAPVATDFSTNDLVVDVKNGRLYYKSNFAVYELKGAVFHTFTSVTDESGGGASLDNALDTQVLFNDNGIITGNSNFTFDNTTGNVSIGGGSLSGITSFTAANDLDIGDFKLTVKDLVVDDFEEDRVVFTTTGGELAVESAFKYLSAKDELQVGYIRLDAQPAVQDMVADEVYLAKHTVNGTGKFVNTIGAVEIGVQTTFGTFNTNENKFLFQEPVQIQGSQGSTSLYGYNLSSNSVFASSGDEVQGFRRDFIITTCGLSYNTSLNAGAIRIRNFTEGYFDLDPVFTNAQIAAANAIELKGNVKVTALTNQVGKFKVTNDVIAFSSDRRLKENIIKIPNPLDKINKLRGVYFDWNEKSEKEGLIVARKKNEIGMIAQEVEKVIPQAIEIAPFDDEYEGTDREKYKTIKYDRLIPLLVECVKEQQKQINKLQKQINEK